MVPPSGQETGDSNLTCPGPQDSRAENTAQPSLWAKIILKPKPDQDSVAKTGTRWQRLGLGGNDGDSVAKTGTRWQRRGLDGKDGHSVAKNILANFTDEQGFKSYVN